eukprot:m.219582 g.219582  ORF g.219582 m.219582 type:complete len:238 (+) comp33296_c2_seq6:61-774(+)
MNSFLFLFLRRLLPSPSTSSNIFPIRGMELTMVSFAVVLLVIMTQTHVDAVSVANVKFSNPAGQCGETTDNNTLGYVSPNGVTMVIAKDAADCCSACTDKPNCASWSMQHEWTPTTPCHLSPYAFVKKHANSPGNSCGTIRDAPPAPPPPPPAVDPQCGKIQSNTGIADFDIAVPTQTATAEACCTSCTNNKDCIIWAWHAEETPPMCHLHGDKATPNHHPGCFSGHMVNRTAAATF